MQPNFVANDAIEHITEFIRQTFAENRKTRAIVGVSGGIDSAVSLTLAVKALGVENVTPVMLPFGTQSVSDGQLICYFNTIATADQMIIPITSLVKALAQLRPSLEKDPVRQGNSMARARMMVIYDLAKERDALVIGTENKSEHYLGYFTRFGDAASDLEPLSHLYKTEVRAVATELGIPEKFLTKAPSAGLWQGQTDELEMGFSYKVADQVLTQLIDQKITPSDISVEGVSAELVARICERVSNMAFKLQVPYTPRKGAVL